MAFSATVSYVGYEISNGIAESELTAWLQNATKLYGIFDDGRINYTHAEIAPIVMCTVQCAEDILLVKRNHGLADAEGYWSVINGFIDEIKPVIQQAQQEIKEELGLKVTENQVLVRESHTLKDSTLQRSYIVFPCLVNLTTKPHIVLDVENTQYAWIKREQLKDYRIRDELPYLIDSALGVQQ